nr:hypothetical protein [Tanacetum cinerariifolium]
PSAAATWQHPIRQPPVTWHLCQHRSAPVNAASHRSTAAVHGGDRRSTPPVNVVIGGQRWRSTTVAGGEPPLTAAGPPLTTTGQRWLVGWSTIGSGPVWIRSGPGLDRVRVGSGSGSGRVLHVACHVSATCAHVSATYAHVAADVDNGTYMGVEPGTLSLDT